MYKPAKVSKNAFTAALLRAKVVLQMFWAFLTLKDTFYVQRSYV